MPVKHVPAVAGGWLAFTSGPRLLVVASGRDNAFVAGAWGAIGLPTGFQALLDLLTGAGLAATPAFVLIDWMPGAESRIIIRGETEIQVTDGTGSQPISAAGVSTWVERSLPGLSAVSFVVPGATPAPVPALPLDHGVALVASVTLGELEASLAGAVAPTVSVIPKASPPVAAPAKVDPASAEPVTRAPEVEPALPAAEIDIDPSATIASVPEMVHDPDPVPAPEAAPAAGGDYDYLFGDTIHRSVSDAAVRQDEPVSDGSAEPADAVAGDHDGHTVLTSDLAKLRGNRKGRTATAPPPPAAAKLVLVLSTTGAREPLLQPILVGRSPSVSKVSGGQIPRLLTIGGIDQDISRNHAQFALEGGTVVVTDLHSKNGTSIVLPGKDAQKLRAGEPTSVIVGTVVDLGGGITFTVDEDR